MTNGNGRGGSNFHFGNSWRQDGDDTVTMPSPALNDPVVITSGPQEGSATEIADTRREPADAFDVRCHQFHRCR